jgi:hypothetical protein
MLEIVAYAVKEAFFLTRWGLVPQSTEELGMLESTLRFSTRRVRKYRDKPKFEGAFRTTTVTRG